MKKIYLNLFTTLFFIILSTLVSAEIKKNDDIIYNELLNLAQNGDVTSINKLITLAKNGDVISIYNLGRMYQNGSV